MSFLREICANADSITMYGHNIQSACTYLKFRLYLHEVNKQVEGHHLALPPPLDYFAAHLNKFYSNFNAIILYFSVMPKYSRNCKVLLKRAQTKSVSIIFYGIFSHVRALLFGISYHQLCMNQIPKDGVCILDEYSNNVFVYLSCTANDIQYYYHLQKFKSIYVQSIS